MKYRRKFCRQSTSSATSYKRIRCPYVAKCECMDEVYIMESSPSCSFPSKRGSKTLINWSKALESASIRVLEVHQFNMKCRPPCLYLHCCKWNCIAVTVERECNIPKTEIADIHDCRRNCTKPFVVELFVHRMVMIAIGAIQKWQAAKQAVNYLMSDQLYGSLSAKCGIATVQRFQRRSLGWRCGFLIMQNDYWIVGRLSNCQWKTWHSRVSQILPKILERTAEWRMQDALIALSGYHAYSWFTV